MPLKQVDLLAEALALHERGMWVVPQSGKRAIALGWQQYRCEADDLATYFGDARPDAVGELPLCVSIELMNSGLTDVECDSDAGEELLAKLLTPEELSTPTWKSRRGRHRLYLRPESGLPDRAAVQIKGIDFLLGVKGHLTTLPPSGNCDDSGCWIGNRKRWEPGLGLGDVPILPLPKALIDFIAKEGKRARKQADQVLNGKIAEGGRNTALTMLSRRLVRVGLDPAQIATTVANHNLEHCEPPLEDPEVLGIVQGACNVKEAQDAVKVLPEPCSEWRELMAAWDGALHMRQDIRDALAVLMAVAISTDQVGDQQLFLQLVANAGSAKTRLCDAMLVSEHCRVFEQVTGLNSGWKMGNEDKDYSLINRINHCTLITPEGDTVFSHPKFPELMAQFRRAFDGSLTATYKNSDVDKSWQGLRMPWIVACTPVGAHSTDQSRLGDRFVRVFIDEPSDEVKRRIQRAVLEAELENVNSTCNSAPESQLNPKMRRAYKLTGGYVDHLRVNAGRMISAISIPDAAKDRLMDFADFTAHLRSLPDFDPRRADHGSHKELPSRLTAQFGRLSKCLAAVLGRTEVDNEVLRIVRKVAQDTARGKPHDIARNLAHGDNPKAGVLAESLATWTNTGEERMAHLLRHMKKIKAVRSEVPQRLAGMDTRMRWFLTETMLNLWREVVG